MLFLQFGWIHFFLFKIWIQAEQILDDIWHGIFFLEAFIRNEGGCWAPEEVIEKTTIW